MPPIGRRPMSLPRSDEERWSEAARAASGNANPAIL